MTPNDHDEPDELHTATDPATRDASASDEPPPRKTSQKQIEANRRNAQRSTGPRTEEGKGRSSRNAVRHGVYGSPVPVPRGPFREDPDEIAAAIAVTVAALKPNNAMAARRRPPVRRRECTAGPTRATRSRAHGRRIAPRGAWPDDQVTSCLERMAPLIDSDLDHSPDDWRAIACLLAIDNMRGRGRHQPRRPQRRRRHPGERRPGLGVHRPRPARQEYYDTPADYADELRARAAQPFDRRATESDEDVLERAAVSLLDEGALEKCSLIRARLGRERDRAFAHFQAMQALPS